jgi:thymidine kinase
MEGLKVKDTRLEIILGPMFSGKSTELIKRTSRYKFREERNKILIINHVSDKRPSPVDGTMNGDSVQTHTGHRHDALKTHFLADLIDKAKEYDVIGIDEAQFFPDLLLFFLQLEPFGKIFIISGLDGDFERKPFGQILQLIPLCDEVTKLTAMSKDGLPAIFTKRTVSSKEQTLVGSAESYEAVSRQGYFKQSLS